jgi:signal transduction histidine kinase
MSAQSEPAFREIVEQLPLGIALLDGEHRVTYLNCMARELLPLLTDVGPGEPVSSLAGRPVSDLVRHTWPDVWLELTVGQEPVRVFEAGCRQLTESPGECVLLLREVTLEREERRQLRHQERLAALGQLAGGVAHDFNNILQAVIGFAEVLARRDDIPDDARDRLETIAEQGRRGAGLVRQLLDFGGRAASEPQSVEIGAFLAEWLELVRRTLPRGIDTSMEARGGPHWVHGDVVRLEQAMLNLALNARDAMPRGGLLAIRLSSLSVGPADTAPVAGMAGGEWVKIAVEDTGIGIAPEHIGRVWEPFYTTKPSGFGTGLGMSQVHGIMQHHSGAVDLRSEPSVGTTVLLYLPMIEPPDRRGARGATA